MDEEVTLEHILGGIASMHDELIKINDKLHKLYNVDMTILAHDSPEIFEKIDLVHNVLGMYMEDNWEDQI